MPPTNNSSAPTRNPLYPGDLGPVSKTVYSAVWPETEMLMRRILREDTEVLLARHRDASTKRQDLMHRAFFEAWSDFSRVAGLVLGEGQFPEAYPTSGSSEAIREIIRSALWKRQDIVVFDGDYEGYEVAALQQGTKVHRVQRAQWRETLGKWRREGTPWGSDRSAQWWVSQPSAIDGNRWSAFSAWMAQADKIPGCDIWVDLCYLGVTTGACPIDLAEANVAGVVFSLSKVMGGYYRRIGGCLAREPQEGLWANRWFKNLDSLYEGTQWLLDPTFRGPTWWKTLADRQRAALLTVRATPAGRAFTRAYVQWGPSDVAMLMHADPTRGVELLDEEARRWWQASERGRQVSGRRLCLTPVLEQQLEPPAVIDTNGEAGLVADRRIPTHVAP